MTTTSSTPSRTEGGTDARVGAALPAVSARPHPHWVVRYRPALRIGAAGLVIIAAYLGVRSWRTPSGSDDPTLFTVQRRSFSVDLYQKGELRAVDSVNVKCEVEGRSTIIYLIPEGTEVKEGDLLVELASNEIAERIETEAARVNEAEADLSNAEKEYEIQLDQNASDVRKAELAVQNARDELLKYEEGDWAQQEMDANLELERAQEELSQAEAKFKDSQELYEKKFITKREYDRDKFAVLVAGIAVKKAGLAKYILGKYTHPKDQRQKESDLAEAEKDLERVKKSAAAKADQKRTDWEARQAETEIARKRLAKYREQEANTKIRAKAPGLVVYFSEHHRWGGGDEIKEGAEVRERQTLITLPDTSVMKVDVRVHEAVATKIEEGMTATVEVEGIPDRVFTGEVTNVAVLADSQNRWLNPDLKEHETEITLDRTDVELKPGVTARVKIHVEDVVDALAVPVQAVFGKGGKHFVFRQYRDQARPVEVSVGPSNDEFVEVTDGIAEGHEILLAVSDDLKREIPEPPTTESPEFRVDAPPPGPAAADRRASSPPPATDRERQAGERRGRPPAGEAQRRSGGPPDGKVPRRSGRPAGGGGDRPSGNSSR
ncbi:MAG: efflux RND transporter periplasmic adaptor subunit [Phycisphaerales bacterium]|nr:MAG: efflux RND transporter periplasmic adaptor subunit [Phycisphaerales bacterium]